MSAAENGERPAGLSDAAVKARTGKTWTEWFAILDQANGLKLGHRGIVAFLDEHFRVGPWWRQMLAVAYEEERGLRKKRRPAEGFQVRMSKVVAVPVAALFDAWTSEEKVSSWLGSARPTARESVAGRSLRLEWTDESSVVDVSFYQKGPEKSQVVVAHRQLADAAEAQKLKEFWSTALLRLKRYLEG